MSVLFGGEHDMEKLLKNTARAVAEVRALPAWRAVPPLRFR